MKKYFLADLIHYLNLKINSNEDQEKVKHLSEFMTSHFPGSLAFH